MSSLRETFDRVVVINLARRRERLARFNRLFADWPFATPQRFDAIDGSQIAIPRHWDKGAGAWGCMLSHRRVLASAIAEGVGSLFVFEDDAVPVPGFEKLAEEFLANVPGDWDCLMFGGDHLRPPLPISHGILKCVGANRMHAFALRGQLIPILLEYLYHFQNEHCDVVLASLMRYFNVYAPDPFLIGQDSGRSDISGLDERVRFLPIEQMHTIVKTKLRETIERLSTAAA